MLSLELQILKIEGFDAGVTCRALLDNEELPIKNSQFFIPRPGIITLEIFKNRLMLGGVLFSAELLPNVAYQYIPIFSPPVYIDNFPVDTDPPRILLIQTASSLETSIISSKCETILLEESLDQSKNSQFENLFSKNKSLKIDIEYYKKLLLNDKAINQAKFEDLNTWIESCNFRNLLTVKNKDFVIKDLQSQRDKLLATQASSCNSSEILNVLLDKVQKDSVKIQQLVSEKTALLARVQDLEQENLKMKTQNRAQDIQLRGAILKENFLRKEVESRKLFEKLSDSRNDLQLREKNCILKEKLEAYKYETQDFKEKYENTEKSYKTLKECLLGKQFGSNP